MRLADLDLILNSTLEPLERLVLVAVASHINRDGSHAWPSLERLAEMTGLSRATVQRHMCSLKTQGVITVRRRFSASSVYSITSIPQKSQSATSGGEQSLQIATSVPEIPPEVAQSDHQKSQAATLTVQGTVQENLPLFQPIVEDDGFNEFWNAYGKKKGKRETQTKWRSMPQRDRDAAMTGLPSYLKETPDPQYRKDPIRYLRHARWEDEPTTQPPSEGGQVYVWEVPVYDSERAAELIRIARDGQ